MLFEVIPPSSKSNSPDLNESADHRRGATMLTRLLDLLRVCTGRPRRVGSSPASKATQRPARVLPGVTPGWNKSRTLHISPQITRRPEAGGCDD